MIDKLIEEMFSDCHACQGTGLQELGESGERECPGCNGDGYDLSYDGYKLRQAIMKGEKP